MGDRAQLKALALAAKESPDPLGRETVDFEAGIGYEQAALAAACDPDTILRLLELVDAGQRLCDEAKAAGEGEDDGSLHDPTCALCAAVRLWEALAD